jgi:hypothetical protein
MKKLLIILILLISTNGFSQVRVEDIGDNWRSKVNMALDTIKKYDIEKYENILKVCNHVTFWNGNFSTTEDSTTIMISQKDMLIDNVFNVAAILVHESYHLGILKHNVKLNVNYEEYLAYRYEYNFLIKIPKLNIKLLEFDIKMMDYYKKKLNIQE